MSDFVVIDETTETVISVIIGPGGSSGAPGGGTGGTPGTGPLLPSTSLLPSPNLILRGA